MIPRDISCLLTVCFLASLETTEHLFRQCNYNSLIWQRVFEWLDIIVVIPNDLQAIYNLFGSLILGEKHRNGIIFKSHTFDGGKLLEEIKINSWEWFLYKKQNTNKIFSSWMLTPLLCLNS
ncbi:hypothetical protein JHK82_019080 [Glycine max]|uniref:Reverse transcriptase zinc-binding domain-containing protein n=2 Tax=Glycine subgen. Soja TaxID=1462606 RepID=A0A0R0J4M2_SOYBN|nr:hypothetical protein JHK87_018948 [Glycine soja]KAG5023177.1 hypothetical protein JHK85_019519 [Glycine max]KAG5143385.1 hypothetical protein JHK82_019080 [Glycine max]KAH1087385.1 hypothetical protein GYH30_018791 [Glycine max]KRH49790.1 hypothetical protein GLYMA_07G179600v4 [Glycine max]